MIHLRNCYKTTSHLDYPLWIFFPLKARDMQVCNQYHFFLFLLLDSRWGNYWWEWPREEFRCARRTWQPRKPASISVIFARTSKASVSSLLWKSKFRCYRICMSMFPLVLYDRELSLVSFPNNTSLNRMVTIHLLLLRLLNAPWIIAGKQSYVETLTSCSCVMLFPNSKDLPNLYYLVALLQLLRCLTIPISSFQT